MTDEAERATPECSEFEEWLAEESKNELTLTIGAVVVQHLEKKLKECWQAAQASMKIKVPSRLSYDPELGPQEDAYLIQGWNDCIDELERLNGCKVER